MFFRFMNRRRWIVPLGRKWMQRTHALTHAFVHSFIHHNATVKSIDHQSSINHVERSDAKNGERGGESGGVCENDDDDRSRGGG